MWEKKKKVKKKYEKTRTNFEDAYLRDGSVDLAEIWNGMFPTPRNFP